ILAFAGGTVTLTAVDISGNSQHGILLQSGGAAILSGNTPNTIDDNTTGIRLDHGASLFSFIASAAAIVSNNDTGISCFGSPIFGLGVMPDFSTGNTTPD